MIFIFYVIEQDLSKAKRMKSVAYNYPDHEKYHTVVVRIQCLWWQMLYMLQRPRIIAEFPHIYKRITVCRNVLSHV